MIAVDTNLLVHAHRRASPWHRQAKEALEEISSRGPWGFSLPVVAEFWSVVTHPTIAGRPSTPHEARDYIQGFTEGGAEMWVPSPGLGDSLLEKAEDLGLGGVRIFDLQIGLIAREAGAREIWTQDRNFVLPAGLKAVHPF